MAGTWKSDYRPGRVDKDGNVINHVDLKTVLTGSRRQMNRRAQEFRTIGSRANSTAMLNGMGFQTKAQKNAYRPVSPNESGYYKTNAGSYITADEIKKHGSPGYRVNDQGNILYKSGKASGMEKAMFGLGKAYAGYSILSAGEGGAGIHEGFTEVLGLGAFDAGLGVGINAGSGMVQPGKGITSSLFRSGAKGALALGRGLATGMGYTLLVTETLNQIAGAGTDSNNWIRRLDERKNRAQMTIESSTNDLQSRHVSQRQRIMNKLSKNAINDRGQYMGNEAMALRGAL